MTRDPMRARSDRVLAISDHAVRAAAEIMDAAALDAIAAARATVDPDRIVGAYRATRQDCACRGSGVLFEHCDETATVRLCECLSFHIVERDRG